MRCPATTSQLQVVVRCLAPYNRGMNPETPIDVRRTLANLDTRCQKIVGGLLAVMIKNPTRVQEREWMSEQLTELTLLAGDIDANAAHEAVELVQTFLQANSETLLRAAFLLFQRVGLDMAERVESGFTFEDAMECGLAYFAE